MKKLALPVLFVVIGAVSLLYYFLQPVGSGNLDVKITNAPVIMPAAYKVYGNRNALNGKYYLFKMLMTNKTGKTLDNLKIEYRIPGYIEWTDLAKIPYLYPGQSSVVACYPKFRDSIAQKMTSSSEDTDIRITYGKKGSHELDESFGFMMEGRGDLVYTSIPASQISSYADLFDNADLIPCFVMPNDPIVKYFAQQIQQKVLKGEDASVYNNPRECIRFMEGIYQATLMAHFVYSGTSGVPENFGDVSSTVQSIRLPREVITGKTGLCIELTLMYASIMEEAGIHAIVFLAPGHAFPGFEVNGEYYAIESTGIGGAGLGGHMTVKEAMKAGQKDLTKLVQGLQAGDQRYDIIDVTKLNSEGVVPMEMKDDDYLRKKVDEIAQSFERRRPEYEGSPQYASANEQQNNRSVAGNVSMLNYTGTVSFDYPSFWNRINNPDLSGRTSLLGRLRNFWNRSLHPSQQVPVLASIISSPDQMASIDVYRFNGTSNPEQALSSLQQILAQGGMRVQYSFYRSNGPYQFYRGQTYSSAGTYQWTGVMKPVANGLTMVVAGAYSQAYGQYQNMLNSIIESVK